jgi:hypothetical protein
MTFFFIIINNGDKRRRQPTIKGLNRLKALHYLEEHLLTSGARLPDWVSSYPKFSRKEKEGPHARLSEWGRIKLALCAKEHSTTTKHEKHKQQQKKTQGKTENSFPPYSPPN